MLGGDFYRKAMTRALFRNVTSAVNIHMHQFSCDGQHTERGGRVAAPQPPSLWLCSTKPGPALLVAGARAESHQVIAPRALALPQDL